MKKAIIIGVLLVTCLTGCRIQMNKTVMENYGNHNDFESLSEGTQAADKEIGDISPNTSISPTGQ